MTESGTLASVNEALAVRIAQCIAMADAHGMPLVAAHLDSALIVLRGSGLAAAEAANDGPPRVPC